MTRKAPSLLALPVCLAALALGAATVQRRSAREIADGSANAVGEVTYSVEDGAAVLRVGTGDAGTVVVGDPWAVHVAPRRRLSPDEYSVEITGPAAFQPDGAILLATNVLSGTVESVVAIRPLDPSVALSSADWRLEGQGCSRHVETTEAATVLRATVTRVEQPPAGDVPAVLPGWGLVRSVEVWAWAGDRRTETWDATVSDVVLRDDEGDVRVSGLRSWVRGRYDGRTGEDWSIYPATNAVRFSAQPVLYNATGTLRSEIEDATDWVFRAGGAAVIRISAGIGGASDDLRIEGVEVGADAVSIAVNASLGLPPYIQTCADLAAPQWLDAAGQSSTYPETQTVRGFPCYVVTVPLDPGTSACFYRAAATTPTPSGGRAVRIGAADTDLWIDGVRCAWTNIAVGGQTLRVLAAQPD